MFIKKVALFSILLYNNQDKIEYVGATVKKINLNEKISKKTTIVVSVLVAVFVLGGIIGGVLGGKAYYEGSSADIVNYSLSSNSNFHLRTQSELNNLLVYKYDEKATSVDLSEIVSLSDGASMKVISAYEYINEELISINYRGNVFNTENGRRYLVLIDIQNRGGNKHNGYFIELVNENQYTERIPSLPVGNDGILLS